MQREDDIVIRRRFIRDTLATAGLIIAPGIIDSAARLHPYAPSGKAGGRVADLEATVHDRAVDFTTTPAVDQLPALLRGYVDAHHLADEAKAHHQNRVHGSLAYLGAFLAANLADRHDFDGAHEWYTRALDHASHADDTEAKGWIAGRATFMPWYRHANRQTIHDGAYAVVTSPLGQMGTTLGQALAASAAARLGYREVALRAIEDSRRAMEHRSEETFTAYSFPSYRWGRFASDVYTRLGKVGKAREVHQWALPAYPPGAVTDPLFMRLDAADCLIQDGYLREGAQTAERALVSLPPERTLPHLLDRGREVASRIEAREPRRAEHLRHILRHMGTVA